MQVLVCVVGLCGEDVDTGYFLNGFPASWFGDFGGVAEWNDGNDVVVGGNLKQLADFVLVEFTDPTGSDAHGPPSNDHVL